MKFVKTDSAGYLVNHVARIFAQRLARGIKPLGLTTGVFPALLELWEEDGLTQKQLVERLAIEQATMANTLARMERDGLVTRKKDERDGRAQRVWLTERARAMRDPAVEVALAVNAGSLATLTEGERAQFVHLMRKIVTARAEQEDPSS